MGGPTSSLPGSVQRGSVVRRGLCVTRAGTGVMPRFEVSSAQTGPSKSLRGVRTPIPGLDPVDFGTHRTWTRIYLLGYPNKHDPL